MILQTQSLTSLYAPSLIPSKPSRKAQFYLHSKRTSFYRPLSQTVKCTISVASQPTHLELKSNKPFPAEVSRTIMELASVGTLSTLTEEGWPLGIGVRFAVDSEGVPVLCLNSSSSHLSFNRRSCLHVQLEECELRTPQCTIQGSLDKPDDRAIVKRLHSLWKKRFEEDVDEDLLYIVAVEKVLQMENFNEKGVWVAASDYKNAEPDPLRDSAGRLVNEINTNKIEDVIRFCNVFVDLNFQVSEAKMVWIDRLGFDIHIFSPQKGVFEVRIPFPREVSDEKGAKSTFNCMSQSAWEVEKNFHALDFEKVKNLKQISC